MNRSYKSIVFAALFSISLSFSCFAAPPKTTVIEHGNGETTTVRSGENGTEIERGAKETTRETHKEAVERVKRESKEKGEKADVKP